MTDNMSQTILFLFFYSVILTKRHWLFKEIIYLFKNEYVTSFGVRWSRLSDHFKKYAQELDIDEEELSIAVAIVCNWTDLERLRRGEGVALESLNKIRKLLHEAGALKRYDAKIIDPKKVDWNRVDQLYQLRMRSMW